MFLFGIAPVAQLNELAFSLKTANFEVMDREIRGISDHATFLGYFERSKQHFGTLYSGPGDVRKPLPDPGLYRQFEEILTVTKPAPVYVNSDLITRGFFTFLRLIPTKISDALRIKIMKLPDLHEEYENVPRQTS